MIVCVLFLFITTFVSFSDAQFFVGPKHKFMCQCEGDKCYSSGVCKENVKCKKGYFGYACQYNNVFDYTRSNISEIADENYDTCVTGTRKLEISFNYTKVRYVRLRMKDYGLYESLLFIFQEADSCKLCDGRHVLPEPNFVEYHCRYSVGADRVIILNKDEIPICHVEISNGRNFALRASKSVPISINNTYNALGLTDGITDFQNVSCYLGLKNPESFEKFEIKIHLVWPIFLSIVEIYDIPPDFKLTETLKVELTSLLSSKILVSEFIESNNLQVKRLILEEDVHNVQIVTLTPYRQFGACEIKLIGDCPPRKYGLACNLDCPNGCRWCTTGGLCIDKSTIKNITTCFPKCFHGLDCKTVSGPVPHFIKAENGLTLESHNSVNGSLFREGETIDYNCSTSSKVPVSLTWSWSYDLQNPTIINGTELNTPTTYWTVLMYKGTRLDNMRLIVCSSNNGEKTLKIYTLIILPPTKPVIEGPDEVTSNTPNSWTCYSNEANYVVPSINWKDNNGDFILEGVKKTFSIGTVPIAAIVFNVKTTLTKQLPATKTYTLECIVIHDYYRYMVEKSSQKNITVLESKAAWLSKNGCNVIKLFVRPWIAVINIICTRLMLGLTGLPVSRF